MNTDVVDQALGNQRDPLMRVVEQLAHGERGRTLLPDHSEISSVLRRESVLEIEELDVLHVLGELYGLDGRKSFVNIVYQLHLIAERLPALFEHVQAGACLRSGFEQRLRVQGLVLRAAVGSCASAGSAAIRLHT